MIVGFAHPGSGLANQLHRIIATRITAERLGVDFSIINSDGFKGKDFMDIDFGVKNDIPYDIESGTGKIIQRQGWNMLPIWNEWEKRVFDPDFDFVEDNTIIDGNFEDERYFGHRLPEILTWLQVEPIIVPDDVCLIGFRGGEYYSTPELGLPHEYFYRAIEEMLEINPNFKFVVHTDDVELAYNFFPEYKVIRDISVNWRSMLCAKYAIISNSSFYVLPRLLNKGITIAPRYFNRYNTKKWDYPQFYYKSFKYI